MVIGIIINISVGALIIWLGLLLWKKQKIGLLHDYHYKNVSAEDIPAYTRVMGIGIIIIGAGIAFTGVLDIFTSRLWWIPLTAGLIGGIALMHKAQKKYNGSWFS